MGFSPENDNKVGLLNNSNFYEINDKVRDFEIHTSNSIGVFTANKNNEKSKSRFINEDRPLQISAISKRFTNNLKSNTFDSNPHGKMKRVRS